MHKTFLAAIAITLFAASLPASADSIEDFTVFNSGLSPSPAGGDQGQTITSSVGSSSGGVSGIDGNSLFVTIDTTGVNPDPAVSGSYGGGIQTDIIDPFTAGEFTSSDPADYNIVFDIAANGFTPLNSDIFLQFRTQFNDNVLLDDAGNGIQLSINQNSPAYAPFITQLAGAGDTPVSVSLPLTAFTNAPDD